MDDTHRRGPLLLLGGRSNPALAAEIGELIGKSPDGATIHAAFDPHWNELGHEIYGKALAEALLEHRLVSR